MRTEATDQKHGHWTVIGRQLASENEGRSKLERAAHLREVAHMMGLAPHTISRFVVLAQFLNRMNVSPQQATSFPIGTVEVIARIYDRDRSTAEQLIKGFDKRKVTYSSAYSILRSLGGKSQSSEMPIDDADRVRSLIGKQVFEHARVQEIELITKPRDVIFKADSLWKHDSRYAAFISETYHVYSTNRGLKNIYISAILCSAEHDFVVVEFIDNTSRIDFLKLVEKLKDDIRIRIRDGGVSTREIGL